MGDAQKAQHPINLLRGWPNPSLLPTEPLTRASQRALSNPTVSTPGLLYGPDPGFQPLREEIAAWLARFYDDPGAADPERICITGGASQNLACVLQVFTDPVFTTAWVVAPAYFMVFRIFDDAGLRMRGVREGKEGVDLRELEESLEEMERREQKTALKLPRPGAKIYKHIIYCVPTFSNPSGKTMTLSNRQELVRIARKFDALIITDDVYDCLQWKTTQESSASFPDKAFLPRLVDIDRTMEPIPLPDSFGNVTSNGSFSKISGPGVRTGWADSTPKFTYGLSQCGSSRSGGAPSQMTAAIIWELLKSGDLEAHIEKVLKPAYKRRYETIMEAVRRCLVPLGVRPGEVVHKGNDVFGGYFIWLELPKNVGASALSKRAKEAMNLIIAPGGLFEVPDDSDNKFESSIRLCFAWEKEENLKEGVERLGNVLKRFVDDGETPIKNGVRNELQPDDVAEFK